MMTTIKHVIDGLSTEGLQATVLSAVIILAVGYVTGQLIRGLLASRNRKG